MIDPTSLDIAMALNFGTPVMVLGRMGTGKYFFSRRAINFIGGDHFQSDMYECRNDRRNYVPDFTHPLTDYYDGINKFDKKIAEKPQALLYFTSIEYIKPHWMMYMFQQAMFSKRKVLMAGESFNFLPIKERCKVVEL